MNMVNVSNNETPLNQTSNAKISASPNNQFDLFSPPQHAQMTLIDKHLKTNKD